MDYTNTNIKDAIDLYPKLGELLAAYGIDCITCEIGSCKIGDILKIHNFSLEVEDTISAQMKDVIDGKDVDINSIDLSSIRNNASVVFSKPIKELVEEHKKIIRLLNFSQYLYDNQKTSKPSTELLNQIIYFIKNYADNFHHAKEEDILFKIPDEKHEIIEVMLKEHTMARGYVKKMSESVENNNFSDVFENLEKYINLLRNHIKKEDEILYVWFENIMTDEEKEYLEKSFEEENKKSNDFIEDKFIDFLQKNYA